MQRSSAASGPAYNVRAVERAMDLLLALGRAEPSLGVTELADELHLHKSTVHRLLVTLEGKGFVEQDPASGRYRLGLKLFELGAVVGSRLELRREALPFLKELSEKSGHTVHLVLLSGYDPIYVEKVENPHSVVTYSQIGKKLPLHATAAGKVLLAHLPPTDQEEVLRGRLTAYTPNTITDPAVLRDHLARVVQQGYAVDDEELELGLRCVAAPIRGPRGQVVAALSLSGLTATLTRERLPGLIAAAQETARAISRRLGYSEALALLREG
ncbi:MAG: IclR family transcriptional regulator, acetate operon repressor [Bacillota bacterium]|jgi:DNA-binding IclR family transcriptional regulator|nr:IclR family transcriptional regulator, acetate operon repressor [Bacillota bacterium]